MDKMVPRGLLAHLNTLWPVLIVSEMVKNGIDTFFVSPGNRNVPIMAAISAFPGVVARFCVDERASAYRALGHAKAMGKPGVLVCTSGTAAANYYPALIEANRDEIPMIVWSADRPPELVGSDANQTIEQTGLFGCFALRRLDLPCPSKEYPLRALLSRVCHLIGTEAGEPLNGPVHLNQPFREPLLPASPDNPGDAGLETAGLVGEAVALLAEPFPYTGCIAMNTPSRNTICAPGIERVRAVLETCTRGLVVAGRPGCGEDPEPVAEYMNDRKWPVFCDIASGLKGRFTGGNEIPLLDHPEAVRLIQAYDPEVIIQFGTGLVSKSYYGVVAERAPQRPKLVQITSKTGVRDPGHQVWVRVDACPRHGVSLLNTMHYAEPDASAVSKLAGGFAALMEKLNRATPSDRLSHPLIARALYGMIPEGEALFAGNSLIVRAFDTIDPGGYRPIRVVTNRGVSGIEGNIATAVGYAESARKRVTAVLGDISFLHDLGSLALLSQSMVPVILVVVNNRGGRIFERLPVAKFSGMPVEWVTTPHHYDFRMAAGQFGIPYRQAASPKDLNSAYAELLAENRTGMIEIELCPETDLTVFEARKGVGGINA